MHTGPSKPPVSSETMDCLPVVRLPEGPEWTHGIKPDGSRLEVVRSAREAILYADSSESSDERGTIQ
jgi:hypothetical protein